MLRSVYTEVSVYPGGIKERKSEVAVYSLQVVGDQSDRRKQFQTFLRNVRILRIVSYG